MVALGALVATVALPQVEMVVVQLFRVLLKEILSLAVAGKAAMK